MRHQNANQHSRPVARFWQSAGGFWKGPTAWQAWLLCATMLAIAVAQLFTQYWLNYWNRDFFNALEQKDAAALARSALLFFPLAAASTTLALLSVWGRMTTQRKWRRYLTRHLISEWLADGHYRHLGHLNGVDAPWNPEYRIAEDARVATDAPIDLVLALFSSLLTAFVFFEILASVGGSVTIRFDGMHLTIPGYLAIGVVVYSGLVTAAMMFIGRRLTSVVQDQFQAEAAFRAAANLIRESGEGIVLNKGESEERRALWIALHNVLEQWRRLCWQHVRTTVVSHGNMLLAPIIGLMLCAPKYISGAMSLGEVTQAAAAFVTVQGAFNWLVDNFHRMADWRSSAQRVATLLHAVDELEQAKHTPQHPHEADAGNIVPASRPGPRAVAERRG
jgi:ABC-type uncharacterized transport system fused permease/ATPase subunit